MILGLDPGLLNLGWSIVEPGTGRVLELGVHHELSDPSVRRAEDLERRAARQSAFLHELVQRHAVTLIAAEELSFPRGPAGITALCLSWGAITGVASARGLRVASVPPKEWERAVVPTSGKRVTYEVVASLVESYVLRCGWPRALEQLGEISPSVRTHALDGVGVGVFGAVSSVVTCVTEPPRPGRTAPARRKRKRKPAKQRSLAGPILSEC